MSNSNVVQLPAKKADPMLEGLKSLYDIGRIALEEFRRIGEILRSGKYPGARIGISEIDAITRGCWPGDPLVIVAPTSEGKSTIAACSALATARDGKKVLFFALEEGDAQVAARFITTTHGIDYIKFQDGDVDTCDQVEAGLEELKELKIRICSDRRWSVMRDLIGRCAARGVEAVYVDHLLKIDNDVLPNAQENKRISAVSAELRDLAKLHKFSLVVVTQMKHGQIEKPTKESCRGSGDIAQDAETLVAVWRPTLCDEGSMERYPAPYVRIGILKSRRRGLVGWLPGKYNVDQRTQSILNFNGSCGAEAFGGGDAAPYPRKSMIEPGKKYQKSDAKKGIDYKTRATGESAEDDGVHFDPPSDRNAYLAKVHADAGRAYDADNPQR
jgi:hypothetical protein